MRVLADIPLWKSYISTHIIAISDFGKTLTTHSFDIILILLKMCVDFMIDSIMPKFMEVLVPSIK